MMSTEEEARRVNEGLRILEKVVQLMSRRLGRFVSPDELRVYGQEVLLDIARTYDPTRASLSTYAAKRFRWAIYNGLRRARRERAVIARANALAASERYGEGAAQQPEPDPFASEQVHQQRLRALLEGHAAALALGLVSTTEIPMSETPEELTAQAELVHVMRHAVRALPDRERALVERHYFGGEPFEAIARDLGISKSWASRLHAQAIDALAVQMRGPEG
jgi:RNA polymerase sigma factor for flagellar operon FliA